MVRFAYGLVVLYLLIGLAGCCAPAHGLNNSIGKHRIADEGGDARREQAPDDENVSKNKVRKQAAERADDDDYGAPLKKKKLAALVPVEKDGAREVGGDEREADAAKGGGLRLLRKIGDVLNPQAILFDRKNLKFFVSRLGGADQPAAGAIALLGRDGSIVDADWVTGLAQPRGLAVSGDYLYVADGNQLVEIEIKNAAISNRFKIDEGLYFDDVARDGEGNLYVSEPLRNTIYRFGSDGQLTRFVQDDMLDGPSRLVIRGGTIFVGSSGLATKEGGKTRADAGGIFKVGIKERAVERLAQEVTGSIAGLVLDDEGQLYAAVDQSSRLFKIDIETGTVISETDVSASFQLSDASLLGDFHYFKKAREFWMPIKSNGQILVFVEADAAQIVEEREGE